jgi:predicted RNase H-like HicB family nuclease
MPMGTILGVFTLVKGVIVGEGDTYEEALHDVQGALKFHIEAFGSSALDPPVGPQ